MAIVLKFNRNQNEHKKYDNFFRKNPHILHILSYVMSLKSIFLFLYVINTGLLFPKCPKLTLIIKLFQNYGLDKTTENDKNRQITARGGSLVFYQLLSFFERFVQSIALELFNH